MTKNNKNHIIIQILSYNYTIIMQFITTTEIARKGSKIFTDYQEAIVLSNNKPIWALLDYKIYEKLKESWFIDNITKELGKEKQEYLLWLQNNLKHWESEEHDNLFA